jgi:hypothetical protein
MTTLDILRRWLVEPRGYVKHGEPVVAFRFARDFVELLHHHSVGVMGLEGVTRGDGPLGPHRPPPNDSLGLSAERIADFTIGGPVMDSAWMDRSHADAEQVLVDWEADPPVWVVFSLTVDLQDP